MSSTKQASLVPGPASGAAQKSKWQQELLMERIRTRSPQHKSYTEMAKSMRMSMLEKRYALDAVEKTNLQKCLDSLQYCIKVTSRQGLVERLESLSRQLGLKFMEDPSGLFISTDMFFLEIILDSHGALTDVKVHHECKIEQQSCSELVNCLNRGDFADFTVQLEGLSSIYQLNAEPKVKTKAFVALQAMETDLYNLFQMQSFTKDTLLTNSIVGLVLKRRGGHPMKLTYFVSPYDLISLETKAMQALSIDLIANQRIGFSVTVNLEASSANKLQILPTVTCNKDPQSEDVPVYAPLTQINSMLLPATFVLRLNKPLPVCYNTLRSLNVGIGGGQDTGSVTGKDAQKKLPVVLPIMNLIIQTASELKLKNSQKGLFVCLPDQTHCYFFTENKQLEASIVSSFPFTEPSQVPKILDFLKKQALFYTLLSSCVRLQSKMGNDMESTIILEVNAISFQQISVSLQHPYEESMVTVEIDLHNSSMVNCKIYGLNQNYEMLSRKLVLVLQKSLSIPLTIRALLKFWDEERIQMFQRNIGISGTGNGACGTGGGVAGQGSGGPGSGNIGNFNLMMGNTDNGSRGSGLNSTIKVEPNMRQSKNTIAGNVTGYAKFPNDIKTEDHNGSSEESNISETKHPLEACQHYALQSTESSIEIVDKYKNIWKDKTPNLKNCVSITPIPNETIVPVQNLDVKLSSGIEIIPLTAVQGNLPATIPTTTATPATITITPINSTTVGDVGCEKKPAIFSGNSTTLQVCGSASTNSKRGIETVTDVQKEKKRKRKRDDSPMGPPATTSDSTSPALVRKFSSPSSPKSTSGGIVSSTTTISTRPSPKHSPVYCSPKHNTASNSPKSPFSTHSPKHGSSGKPCMSTLKSAAATSLSPKSSDKCGNSGCGIIAPVTTTTTLVRSMNTSTGSNITNMSLSAGKGREKEKMPNVNSTTTTIKANLGMPSIGQLKTVSNVNHLTTTTVMELNNTYPLI